VRLELTQRLVNTIALQPGRNDDVVWDTQVENFGLRLRRHSGGVRRVFICQYRVFSRSRRHTIGAASKLTLVQARDAAKKVLARVQLGGDPQGDKAARRVEAGKTLGNAIELYLAAKARHVRPATLRSLRLYLTGSYFKPLHRAPLTEIKRADIAARLTIIDRDRGQAPALAARRAINAMFSWAMEEGLVDANPVIGTRQPPAAPSRDRVLTDAELIAIWNAAGDDDYGRVIRLLILTGARRQEVGGIRWDEFDLGAGVWTLPAMRSKNHRSHMLPLPPAALEILAAVPRNGREFVFGERSGAGFATWSRHKEGLDRLLGDTVAPWTVHDLRRTFATRLADISVEPHIIEALLGHFSGHRAGVAGVYNRSSYEGAMKAALARWAEHVAALVGGRKSSNIVALKHR
jgi:integrase